MTIPYFIKATRMARGLTQQQLGEMCGYSGRTAETTIQHWESGRREIPLNKVRRLAVALQLSVGSLIP